MLAAGMVALLAAAAPTASDDLPLLAAAEHQDWRSVHGLPSAGADVNAAQADGATALHWAAHWDDLAAVETLLQAGADVDAANDHGVTPLFLAAENRSAPVAERLLAAGADASATLPADGETVLMRAAHSGSTAIVRMLLDRGADPHARAARSGQTALMWAIAENHAGAARELIEHGGDVRGRSHGHYTPLLFAARQGNAAIAAMLLGAGVPVDRDGPGPAPLVVAIEHGRVPFARFLLERGANPDIVMRNGSTPLAAAFAIGGRQLGYDPDAVVYEPPDKARPGSRPAGGRGRPQSSSGRARGRIARLLPRRTGVRLRPRPHRSRQLRRGAQLDRRVAVLGRGTQGGMCPSSSCCSTQAPDPTVATDDGTTPLMVAAGLGHAGDRYEKFWSFAAAREAVEFLVERGADVNAANAAGFTALHGAAFVGGEAVRRAPHRARRRPERAGFHRTHAVPHCPGAQGRRDVVRLASRHGRPAGAARGRHVAGPALQRHGARGGAAGPVNPNPRGQESAPQSSADS